MPWRSPSQTGGDSIHEDRLVLPIPPGTHWSDAKPMVLPGAGEDGAPGEPARLEGPAAPAKKPKAAAGPKVVRPPVTSIASGGLWFAPPPAPAAEAKPEPAEPKPTAVKKNDPRLVAAARELRDRWLEEVNAGRFLPVAHAKYEVGRLAGEGPEAGDAVEVRQLEQPRAVLALPALPEAACGRGQVNRGCDWMGTAPHSGHLAGVARRSYPHVGQAPSREWMRRHCFATRRSSHVAGIRESRRPSAKGGRMIA